MGLVTFGPALVSNLRGAASSFVFTWNPPRASISGRKRGVRDRKVGRHSVPKLLARLDIAWRALPLVAKNALRPKATAARLTNYIWFRRHMLNHQRRVGYLGPIQLNLNSTHYKPIENDSYAAGDITELAWDDPASSEVTLDLTNIDGVDVTQVQDAIHCELIPPTPPAPPWDFTWSHVWVADMPPYWEIDWHLVMGDGSLWLWTRDSIGQETETTIELAEGEHYVAHRLPIPPTVEWHWRFTPLIGPTGEQTGTDSLW